jgi:hypothetical protein
MAEWAAERGARVRLKYSLQGSVPGAKCLKSLESISKPRY